MSFWQELNRRHVFRVGAIYLAVSWLIIQGARSFMRVHEGSFLKPGDG